MVNRNETNIVDDVYNRACSSWLVSKTKWPDWK